MMHARLVVFYHQERSTCRVHDAHRQDGLGERHGLAHATHADVDDAYLISRLCLHRCDHCNASDHKCEDLCRGE